MTVFARAVLALLLSLSVAFVGVVSLRAWAVSRAPVPSPVAPGTVMTPVPLPSGNDPEGPTPEQTVGPVPVDDRVQRGVVLIAGQTPADSVAGTGMVLTPDGLVLTNYHVVRSTASLTVTVASTGRSYDATLVGRDATADIALLRLDGARDLEVVTIDRDPVDVGDVVVAAGNANGQGYVTAHRGNVQALGRSIQVSGPLPEDPPETLSGLVQTNAPAWPGDSGGPMYDADLEVLGMTTAGGAEDVEDRQVYAVPIAEALDVVERIGAGDDSGSVVIGPKAYLGIVVEADDSDGVVVQRVEPGSAAQRAGLAAGDRILTLNRRPTPSRLALAHLLDEIRPGTGVPLTWETQGGRAQSGEITPAESPLN